jgi:hypothetical protein
LLPGHRFVLARDASQKLVHAAGQTRVIAILLVLLDQGVKLRHDSHAMPKDSPTTAPGPNTEKHE